MDKRQLTVEQQAALEQWQFQHDQLEKLEDVAAMAQKMVILLEDANKGNSKNGDNMGSLLVDMRETLESLKNKEDPDFPDYAKPVVEAVKSLETKMTKAFVGIDFKPEYKPEIKVDAPVVNVDAPDLKGVEKLLKEGIPKAFDEAVKGIKFPTIPDDEEYKKELLEWLESIDKGVHTHPTAPTQIKVTNPDGSYIGETQTVTERYDYSDTSVIYTATAAVGTDTADNGWSITKYDLTDPSESSGKLATDVSWDDRASGGYA